MTDSSNPHEPAPEYPPLTPRALLVITGLVSAFPLALFAIEHPTVAATSLLLLGAVTTAISRE